MLILKIYNFKYKLQKYDNFIFLDDHNTEPTQSAIRISKT